MSEDTRGSYISIETQTNPEDLVDITYLRDIPYKKIIISGGATKGFASMGALQYLHDNNILESVEHYAGTSVGAIISYFYIIGYSPKDLLINIFTSKFLDNFIVPNLVTFIEGDGFFSFESTNDFMEKLTLEKLDKIPTLSELAKMFKKTLTITTYNLSKQKLEYLSKENYPDLSCLVALRMSSTIPLVFPRFQYLNCYYIDGGYRDNFPVSQAKFNEKTIAVGTVRKLPNSIGGGREVDNNNTFKIHEYLLEIFLGPLFQNILASNQIAKEKPYIDLLFIDTPQVGLTLTINNIEALNLFSVGYNAARNFNNLRS